MLWLLERLYDTILTSLCTASLQVKTLTILT